MPFPNWIVVLRARTTQQYHIDDIASRRHVHAINGADDFVYIYVD